MVERIWLSYASQGVPGVPGKRVPCIRRCIHRFARSGARDAVSLFAEPVRIALELLYLRADRVREAPAAQISSERRRFASGLSVAVDDVTPLLGRDAHDAVSDRRIELSLMPAVAVGAVPTAARAVVGHLWMMLLCPRLRLVRRPRRATPRRSASPSMGGRVAHGQRDRPLWSPISRSVRLQGFARVWRCPASRPGRARTRARRARRVRARSPRATTSRTARARRQSARALVAGTTGTQAPGHRAATRTHVGARA